ncbi:MAG: hypothetical protein WBG62_09435, partial [Cyclobacteriaceae bacterium]
YWLIHLHLHPVPTIQRQQGSAWQGLLFLFEHPQLEVVGHMVTLFPGSSQAIPSLSASRSPLHSGSASYAA